MIELSMNDFIRLYKLASIGKLVGGLIHNLNGPMQNLGLDIEMAYFSLKDVSEWDSKTTQSIISRLKRMEEEHERINSLIRTTAAKTGDDSDLDNSLLNIYEYLKQELIYLHTNLYFKHNVKTEIITANDPPLTSSLTRNSIRALGWFLQSIVEELEKQKINGLTLKIISDNATLKIMVLIQGGKLSEDFTGQIKDAILSSDTLKSDSSDLGIFLALTIFKSNGVTLELDSDSPYSNLIMNFPLIKH